MSEASWSSYRHQWKGCLIWMMLGRPSHLGHMVTYVWDCVRWFPVIIHNYHQNSIASSSLIPILVFSSPHRFATCRYEGNLNSILFTPVYCFTSTNRTRLVKTVKHTMLFRLLATEPKVYRIWSNLSFFETSQTHTARKHTHTLSLSLSCTHCITLPFYSICSIDAESTTFMQTVEIHNDNTTATSQSKSDHHSWNAWLRHELPNEDFVVEF